MKSEPDRERDARVLETLRTHGQREDVLLDSYRRVVEETSDEGVRYLGRLIVEDEERHHGLLKRIEATLRDAIDWKHSPNALPTAVTPSQPVMHALIDTSTALIKEEHTGAHHLRELAHREKLANSGLTSLLLEMMAMDSDKHAHLLQFVHDRLASRPREEDGPRD